MAYLNENYSKLKAGYLFPEIARRVKTFSEAHPDAAAKIIRCGIGDVTEPLPAACREALHQAVDELGQLLTGIKMELRLIENDLSNREDRSLNPVIDKLVDTAEMVDSTIGSVQRIAAGLRPSALDYLGLPCALNQEAERFAKRTGIPCAIDVKEPETAMSPEVETVVFRIFQESLTNIARHAHASKVEADCAENEGVLRLSVRDNGDGMDLSALDDPDSLGLIGMLERAETIGGSVCFIRHPDEGTEVVLTVPLAGKPGGEGLAA